MLHAVPMDTPSPGLALHNGFSCGVEEKVQLWSPSDLRKDGKLKPSFQFNMSISLHLHNSCCFILLVDGSWEEKSPKTPNFHVFGIHMFLFLTTP